MNSFNLITKYFFKIKQDTCMRKKEMERPRASWR
jgi:hypothetical protein